MATTLMSHVLSSSCSPRLLEVLRCPICGTALSSPRPDVVVCGESHSFSVLNGIPRLIAADALDSERHRTADAFGYSWTHYPKENPYTEAQWRDWVVPLTESDFEGKRVLDAGCGLAGFAEYAESWGAAYVVGVDLSEAVQAARERVGERVDLVQADLYGLPFADGTFDLAYSIGVLHHLPDPERGFRSVAAKVRPGGLVFAWVYGRENNGFIVRLIDPLRRLLFSRLPRGLLKWAVALPLAAVLWPLVLAARHGASFPYAPYFRFLAGRDFEFTHGVVFDQLVAPTTHYLRRDEFEDWFRRAGLVDVTITWRNENSWRGLGRVADTR